MRKLLLLLAIIVVSLVFPLSSNAAMVRSEESIYIAENQTGLRDLYLFGSSIAVDAPVERDLITAGGDVTLNGDVSGSLMVAGGDIVIRSKVGNTLRVAGGNVTISGPVENDLLIAGGNIRITKDASISGDLLFFGGQVRVDGPVQGKIYGNGGEVFLNSQVGGNVEGDFGELTIGSSASISGNLQYTAQQRAKVTENAVIGGEHRFQVAEKPREKSQGVAAAFTTASVYKLLADIAISLLFALLLPRFAKELIRRAHAAPITLAEVGFLSLAMIPFISLLLLFLVWLGLASFLLYGLLLIISLFVGKLLLGWWILHWWNKREKKEYELDWKAAVIGPVVMFILFLIPLIGWLGVFIIYLISIGAVTRLFLDTLSNQRQVSAPKK